MQGYLELGLHCLDHLTSGGEARGWFLVVLRKLLA